MKVSLINQSNNESILLSNQEVTIIGRGVFGITDKRISKHHGEITVQNNRIKIKSCHKNPIYFKIGNDSTEILYQDADVSLNNNDFFSLLPDNFEFQVKVEHDTSERVESSSNSTSETTPFRVREITEINDNLVAGDVAVTLSQVMRNIPDDESNAAQPQVSSSSATATSRKRSIEAEITTELPKKIKTEPPEGTDTASTSKEVQIKPDPDSTNPQLPSASSNVKQEPDSSNVKTVTCDQPAQNIRPSCEHGIRCFRHNPEHRRDSAHPGDNDYRRPDFPPAAPNAPRCPFWEACYRRNPDHFRMFEHPSASAVYDPNQQPPRQAQSAVIVSNNPRPVINVNVYYDNEDDDLLEEDEDIFDDGDDTDVDADYEINGDSVSEDENNLEE